MLEMVCTLVIVSILSLLIGTMVIEKIFHEHNAAKRSQAMLFIHSAIERMQKDGLAMPEMVIDSYTLSFKPCTISGSQLRHYTVTALWRDLKGNEQSVTVLASGGLSLIQKVQT